MLTIRSEDLGENYGNPKCRFDAASSLKDHNPFKLTFPHIRFQHLDPYKTKREIRDKQGTLDQMNPLSKNDPARADVRKCSRERVSVVKHPFTASVAV